MDPRRMAEAVARSMEERTGRTIEEWTALVQAEGPDPLDQKAVRRWLKDEHGIKQNSRYAIADTAARAAGWEPPGLEEYVDRQYSGPKAHLRPIFDRLREILEGLGGDVRVEGRKSYIPFVRGRQFAAVAAATRSRVDVGVRYTEPPPSERLEKGRAPGQGTHGISLRSVEEITDEIADLLRVAYEQNG